MFGLASKEVIDKFGEKGIEVIIESVFKYGEQRGKRVAQMAAADGFESTVLNYLAYKEWAVGLGEIESKVLILVCIQDDINISYQGGI